VKIIYDSTRRGKERVEVIDDEGTSHLGFGHFSIKLNDGTNSVTIERVLDMETHTCTFYGGENEQSFLGSHVLRQAGKKRREA